MVDSSLKKPILIPHVTGKLGLKVCLHSKECVQFDIIFAEKLDLEFKEDTPW